ncbi:MAG TPA: type II toxin-antitoxin system RelE/ParE family toxin [Firmicutes bacterium]|nr:type II toxin-antitoxin system RelE/ParE family toxin [Bacillota bacterium]
MRYKVRFTDRAAKALKKLNKFTATTIISWIKKNLEDCENPRAHGKALTADRTGQWRYRVGDYRLIADIQDDTVIILILEIGHRREIYKS